MKLAIRSLIAFSILVTPFTLHAQASQEICWTTYTEVSRPNGTLPDGTPRYETVLVAGQACYDMANLDGGWPGIGGDQDYQLGGGSGAGAGDTPSSENQDERDEQCTAGNPIVVATGEKTQHEVDFANPVNSLLSIERGYRSFRDATSLFGAAWRSNFDYGVTVINHPDFDEIVLQRGINGSLSLVRATTDDGDTVFVKMGTQRIERLIESPAGWTYFAANGQVENYDANGLILSIDNVTTNETIVFVYETIGGVQRLTRVNGNKGGSLKFQYVGGRINSITDNNGGVYFYSYSYTYDGYVLSGVNFPGNDSKTYHYGSGRLLTGISMNGTRFATWAYDSQGRAVSSSHGNGVDQVLLDYSSVAAGYVTETNPKGKQTKFWLSSDDPTKIGEVEGLASSNCIATSSLYTFDDNGYTASTTDPAGNTTTFERDFAGNIITEVRAAGQAQEKTITTQWHAFYNKPKVITEGTLRRNFSYNNSGQLVQEQWVDLATQQTRTTTYSYTRNNDGQLIKISVNGPQPGSADTIDYHYDNLGRLYQVNNGLFVIAQYSNFDGMGQPTLMVDPNGIQISMSYDARGRLSQLTKHYPSGDVSTSYTYAVDGQLKEVFSPTGLASILTYDAARRHVSTTLQKGSGMPVKQRFSYDTASNLTATRYSHIERRIIQNNNCTPSPCRIDDTVGDTQYEEVEINNFIHTQQYDELNRPLSAQTGALRLSFAYDARGNVIAKTDGQNQTTLYEYDAHNRLIKETAPDGSTVEFSYNANGHLTEVTDAKGNITSYTVNAFGDVLSRTSPDTGTTTYGYNAAGQLTLVSRANGTSTTLSYDGIGRVTQRSSGDVNETFSYDNCSYGVGKLCHTTDRAGSTDYDYTAAGQLASVTRSILGASYTTQWVYDEEGRVVEISYPSGILVDYEYDGMVVKQGRPSAVYVTINGVREPVMTMLNHEAFGPLRYGTYGNDLSAFRQYTSGYELKSSYVGGGWAPLTTEYQNFYFQAPYISQAKLAYNSAGNIVSIEDVLGSELDSFTYDNRSRLTQRKRNGNSLEVYNYDANGNRTRFNNEYYRVDADSNQLTGHRVGASGSFASIWSYDSAGNQLQKETHTWTYGGDNRVRRLTRSSGFYYENWYDTNGQRVAKSSTTTDWHFLYGQSGELLSETKNGPHVKSYIWLEGELVALVYNDDLYFVHNDHLGRPHKVTDDTKAVVWEADLQSFDRSVVSSSIGALNIGFPGQYWDSESGTWQNWHRDYDPSTGRYIQSDPIGLYGGLNTYAYVDSNPLLYSDPDGLSRKKMVGVVCLGMSVGAFAFDAAGVRTAAMNAYENNPYARGVAMLGQAVDELGSAANSCNNLERKVELQLKQSEMRDLYQKMSVAHADWAKANNFDAASGTLGVMLVVAVGTCGSLLR